MIHLAAFLFAYAGLAALCLSMVKHQHETLGRRLDPRAQRGARLAGWALLATAYVCASIACGWNIGPVAWTGAVMVAGLCLTLLLPYRPRWTPHAAVGAMSAGLALTLFRGAIHLL